MKKINRIFFQILALTMILSSAVSNAFAQNSNCINAYMVHEESCSPGHDGIAFVFIPSALDGKCTIEWQLGGGQTSNTQMAEGLTKGTYHVTVRSNTCPNVIFYNGSVSITKGDECDVKVSIDGPDEVTGNCNGIPSVTFTATVSGGTPPYTFTGGWTQVTSSMATKQVQPSEGSFSVICIAHDATGNYGGADMVCYAKKMECAQDPNEIKGPAGYSEEHHFVSNTNKMNYTIDFENDPDFAMAPASRVKITYDIPDQQQLSSFRLADFGFGDFVFTVPSNVSSYSQRLDVSDSLGVWVDVNAGIDIIHNQAFWIFQSVDPATGAEPVSSQMGFLPINDSLEHGQGYVSFYISPNETVLTGDTVGAEALIVFDDNAPIGTNVWVNTFDAVAPTSTLHAEMNELDSLYCTFSFEAQDDPNGSGVQSVEVYMSVNEANYISLGSVEPDSTMSLSLENGIYYQFMSIATDNVGNKENFKAQPDTAVNFNTAPIDLVLNGNTFYEYDPANTTIGTFYTLDNDINLPFIYELVEGEGDDDNALFTIEGNVLKTDTTFVCSHQTEYTVRVRTTDIGGLYYEASFILNELIQHETPVVRLNKAICQGSSINFYGRELTEAGTYTDTLHTAEGCDSIVIWYLQVNPIYNQAEALTICESELPYVWRDTTFEVGTESGDYVFNRLTVNGCDSIVTLSLTVNPTVEMETVTNQYICHGEETEAVAFSPTHGVGAMSYAWVRDNAENVTGMETSGTGDIASATLSNLTNMAQPVIFTVTPTYTYNNVSCVGISGTFTVAVNPQVVMNEVNDQVLCHADEIAAINFGTTITDGTMSYAWTRDNTENVTGVEASGTGDITGVSLSNLTNIAQTVTFTVIPTYTNNGIDCIGDSHTFTVTVNPQVVMNDVAAQIICHGSEMTAVNFGTTITDGTMSYAWTRDNDNVTGVAASGTGNIEAVALSNLTNIAQTVTFTVTPTYTNNGIDCIGDSHTFTVTVNPQVVMDEVAAQNICHGGEMSAVNFSTTITDGTMSYTWTRDNENVTGVAASGTGNIGAASLSNMTTAAQTVTFTVIPTYTNNGIDCIGDSHTFTVTVNPQVVMDEVAAQVICNGAEMAAVNFSTTITDGIMSYAWTRDNDNVTGVAASGTGNIEAVALSNLTSVPQAVTFTVVPTYTNNGIDCIGDSHTFTVTVNPTAQVNQPENVVVCNGESVSVPFATVNTGGTTTYTWTNNETGIGLAASGEGDIAAFAAVNNGTAPVVATITVTPYFTNAGVTCDGPEKTFTVTVNPTAQVNDVDNQVVCNNATTTTLEFSTVNTGGTTTYTWTNNVIGIGLAAAGEGSIAAFTAVNSGNAPVEATITVTPHFTNEGVTCDGPAKTFTITVNPTAQVNQPENEVVCNGASASVTFATANTDGTTTYSWTNDNAGIGLAASGNGDLAFVAENNSTAPVMATITVTPHFTNAGVTCDGPEQTFTITVNPTANVNDIADQVLCDGSATTSVVFGTTNTGGTTTYSWTNDVPSIGLAAAGEGDIAEFTAVNNGTAPVVATITVTPHFTNGNVTCDGTPKSFTITVNPAAQMNQPENMVVCNGASASLAFATTNTGGTTTYTWSNDDTSIGLAASGEGDLAFNAVNNGTAPVVATITVTPHFTNGNVTCDGTASTFTITVNPTVNVNDIADQVLCNGSTTAAVAFSTTYTGGTTTYTWTNSETGIGLAASGEGDIAAFAAVNNGTAPVVATITVTPHFANGNVTCDGLAQSFTITVNPTAQVNQPENLAVCNGGTTTAVEFSTVNTGGTATTGDATTYTWTNNETGIGLAAAGEGDIAAFTAVNSGNAPVVAIITVTPHYANEGVTCDGPAKTFTITVNPTAQVNQPENELVCNGASATVTFATANTDGTTTYSWTNDNAGIGLAASGNGDLTFVAVNNSTAPVMANITVTPHFTNGNVTCDGPEKTFTITVNPAANVNDIADQVLCDGSTTASVAFGTTNTGGTTTFSWTNDAPSIGLAAAGEGNIAEFTAMNNGNAPVVATITVTPHFTNGDVTCDGTPKSFTITVNPAAQVNQPENMVVCNGASASLAFATSNTGGTTTYTWTNDNAGIGLAASGEGDLAFTAVNEGTTPVTATISVTPQFTNGGVSCSGSAKTFTITVNPTATVNDIADQVLCDGSTTAAVAFSTTYTGGTTTYIWTNDAPSIGLATYGTGDIAAFTAVNNSNEPVVATITVTPHFANGNVTCEGTPKSFTITVNPTAQVNDIDNQVVCNGDNTTSVGFSTVNIGGTTTGGTTTYTWTNSDTGIGLAASGTGNIASFTAVNNGTAPVVATITVTPTYTNGGVTCDGPAKSFTITVNPTANVNDIADQVVCNGSTTTTVAFGTTNTGGTMTYSWTNNTPSIGLAGAGTGDIAAFTAVNNGTEPVVATITVTPSFTNGNVTCEGLAKTFTIMVNPTAQVNDIANQVVCNGDNTTAVEFSTTVTGGTTTTDGVTTYTWTNSETSIGLAASGEGDIAAFAAVNNGTSPVVATITVTPHFANGDVTCGGLSKTFTITVNPTAQVNDVDDLTVCNGDSTTLVAFSSNNTGGTTTYSWTNDETSIGLAASGEGDIAAFEAVNNGTEPVVATVTVTPHFTHNGVTCDGTATTFTITVNPTAQVNVIDAQVVCNGDNTTAVAFSTLNTGGTTSYSWMNDETSIGLAASGEGDIAAFAAVNSGTAPVVATITVTPHFTNGGVTCDGPATTFTMTVNPTAQVNDIASQVVCNGSTTAAVEFSTVNTGGSATTGGVTTYTWTNSETGIGLAASGEGDIAAFTAVNNGTAPVVATITVTPHYTNDGVTCDGQAKTFTFTVNPTAQVNDIANQVVCNGSTTTDVTFSTTNTGGTTTYTWTNSEAAIGLAASGTGNVAAFTAVNNGTQPVVATITVTPHFANGDVTCEGPAKMFTITVNPTYAVTDAMTICASELPYTWNGVVFTAAGTQTATLQSVNGCDSVVTMTLTVNQPTTGIDVQEACDSFEWIDGVTYTESTNTPTFTLQNAAGCDSVVTLHLTIYQSVTVEIPLIIDESDLPYTIGDTTFEPGSVQSGDYIIHLTSVHGCDSTIILHLTVTGVDDYAMTFNMNLYPNPTTDKVNVQLTTRNNEQLLGADLQLYDMYGKLLYTTKMTEEVTVLDLSTYASGVYFVKAFAGHKLIGVRKVVKR